MRKIKVFFIARLLRSKGLLVFLNAVTELSNDCFEFHVCGEYLPKHYDSISLKDYNRLLNSNSIVYHGHVNNIESLLKSGDILVYPSSYGEGVPKVILEAMANNCCILTTLGVGCRETVVEGWNGFFLLGNLEKKIVDYLNYLYINREKLEEMKTNSKVYARIKFNVDNVNASIFKFIENISQNEK